MKLSKFALGAAALFCAVAANASVVGTAGGGYGSFLSLASTGPLAGTFSSNGTVIATETGGSIMNFSTDASTMPVGTVGNYLSDSGTGTTTLTFSTGVSYLSFLWGTPDTYNVLTVNGVTFHGSDFGFPDNGVPGSGGYVQFTGTEGTLINTLAFSNSPQTNAFETANYSITPVPEPETYALLLAGLGVMAFVARRRKS